MHRYSSCTSTLVQTLLSKREKYNKYQSLLLKTHMHESFVPGRYHDAHEYYIQLINNLTELFDARKDLVSYFKMFIIDYRTKKIVEQHFL